MNTLNKEKNINVNTPNQITACEIPFAKQNDLVHNSSQNYINIQSVSISDKPLLPMTNNFEFDEEESLSEEVKKQSNLLFEEKQVSAFKLYLHLSEPYEILLMILGTIAALGAGVAAPLMCYFFEDMANDFSSVNVDDSQMELLKKLMDCKNQDEINALAGGNPDKIWIYTIIYNQAKEMFNKFDDNVDDLVKKLLIIGACMFIAFGFEKFLWCYVGMRQMHHLKEKYFSVILRQEQGWFDANNAYEFSTKVQAQFEQITLGVGEKFELTLQAISQVIAGLIIAFTKSWLLTLVMLAISPTIFFLCIIFSLYFKKTYDRS